jgi:hypothetical protein
MFSVKTRVMAGIFNCYRVAQCTILKKKQGAQLQYSINVIICAIY